MHALHVGFRGGAAHRGLAAVAIFAFCIPLTRAASAAGRDESAWDGSVRIERFRTTDLFPGIDGIRRPDWGSRAILSGSVALPLGSRTRAVEWVRLAAERYDVHRDADLRRWSFGSDVSGRRYRARVYGEWTNDELSFPVEGSAGAIMDRAAVGGDLRVQVRRRWYANARAEYERRDFVPGFDDRDGHRWNFRTGVERSFGRGRRVGISHLYRRARAASRDYNFEQNVVRAHAEWVLPLGIGGELDAGIAQRNFRTGQVDAANFGRGDDGQFVSGTLEHAFVGPISAAIYQEWRRRDSTLDSKSYDVSTIGLALTASRR